MSYLLTLTKVLPLFFQAQIILSVNRVRVMVVVGGKGRGWGMNINIQALNYFKDQYPSFLRFSGTMGMGDLCAHFLRIDARFSFSKRVSNCEYWGNKAKLPFLSVRCTRYSLQHAMPVQTPKFYKVCTDLLTLLSHFLWLIFLKVLTAELNITQVTKFNNIS